MATIIEWVRCPICSNKTRIKIRDDKVSAKMSQAAASLNASS